MKIYYYKQRQNTFALFEKRSIRSKRWYLAGAISLAVSLSFAGWQWLHHSASHTTTNTSTTIAPEIQKTENSGPPLSIDEEAQETTFNLQKNIQKDSQILEDTSKHDKESQAVSLQIGTKVQTITIKPKDTLERIFNRAGITKKELNLVLKSGDSAKILRKLKPGQKLVLTVNKEHNLEKLIYAFDATNVTISRVNNIFQTQVKTLPLEPRQTIANFTVYSSVYASANKAGVDSKRLAQLANIFKTNIDFGKGNHTGDKVSVLFQDYYLNGKKVKEGEIVAAEYKTATNTYQAVRFTDPNGNSGYYAPDGTSMEKRFLAAPVKFTRISSLFNPNRWHPVLHRFRHHQGVDYAAPYGTPIKSVASGTIALLGRKGGYGNTIMIKHDQSYSTLYGHLSKYAASLKVGSHVQQGEIIGYVGSSGLATGPHLHFEFRINGVHRNPLTVALPNGKSITHAYRNKFHNEVKKLLAKLDAHKNSTRG